MATDSAYLPGIPRLGMQRELPFFSIPSVFPYEESPSWVHIKEQSQKRIILSLLQKYGTDTLSYFSLQKNRKYFFSASYRSFLSYCIKGNVVVVATNPIGDPDDIPVLVHAFFLFLKKIKKTPCFLGISKEYARELEKRNFKVFKIGEEAIINLTRFDERQLKKKVRRVLRHMQRSDVYVRIYNRHHIPSHLLKQIKVTSKMWLAARGKKERGFSMTLGSVPQKFHRDCEFVIAVKGERVLGYLCFVPVYKGNAWSLDSMRRRETAPNGLMEFLMISAAKQYKVRGFTKLSLNFATFANSTNDVNSRFIAKVLRIIYRYLSKFYPCESLHTFNKKFLPEWKSRFVAFPSLRSLPFSALAIIKAEKIF